MKYKVGDRVRVRRDLVVDKRYGNDIFISNMKKYSGKIMTISYIFPFPMGCKYELKEDADHYGWTDEMLEDVEDVEDITILIKDNKVIAKMGNKIGIAKCSPEDEFDIFTGARLAIDRLEEKCKPYSWLKYGDVYYVPSLKDEDLYDWYTYANDIIDKRMISRGIAFKTKEEAINCAKKMLSK